MTSLTYREEYEHLKLLHEELPHYVSQEHIMNDLLPTTALAVAIITVVFVVSIFAVKAIFRLQAINYSAAYQVTNFLVNLSFGIMGIMYFRQNPADPSLRDLVVGETFVYPLGCAQLGYNLWAIPVGYFVVNETPMMLGHHAAVIVVAGMALFLPLGYRYYAPFMFGILETSSVPLALVNAFKDNPEYIKKYPTVYTVLRFTFLFSFIYVRWWLYLPIKATYLRQSGMGVVLNAKENLWFLTAYTGIVWIASLFVCLLQVWWGSLILKALVKFITKKEDKASLGKQG